MALPGSVGVTFFIGLVVAGVGLLLEIVGLSTPEWVVNSYHSSTMGLWEACGLGLCVSFTTKSREIEVCEAFAILGMLAAIAAVAVAVIYLVLAAMGKNKKVIAIIVAVAAVASLVCVIICVCVFDHYFIPGQGAKAGYSFILNIIGGILTAIGGVLVAVFG
ncbi:epithelial membrane protein 1-like [Physella acuta]|uniref:epithelial membrane protein 1-like n=1 Tax=Physella acuta TaxID=109671 RepID=UPI0027DCD863|nr:epithelial membrane protein 1-like [Physella acuta]XP_059142024.1 epithelial membrane protein 1-like [Physella acuta]